jgi:hypothetical protein
MRRLSSGIVGGPIVGFLSVDENDVRTLGTNVDLKLSPNGSGQVTTSNNILLEANAGLRLGDADSSNYIEHACPASVSANITYTWPGTITGGNVLSTDASGNLSWIPSEVTVTNDTTTNALFYPTLTSSTGSAITGVTVSSTKLSFNPSSGTLTATALVESSSVTLKENIAPITNALDSILKLKGVIYDRKDGTSNNEAGLIAEEVYKILPNLVTRDQDGNPEGITYTKFSAYLIEAIKELSSQIEQLKK